MSFDPSTWLGVDPERGRRVELWPISRSRTQPPTTSARPPASRTAAAMARTRSRGSGMFASSGDRLAAELPHDSVADSRRNRVQEHEAPGLPVRIHLRYRTCDRPRDGVGDLIGGLPRSV